MAYWEVSFLVLIWLERATSKGASDVKGGYVERGHVKNRQKASEDMMSWKNLSCLHSQKSLMRMRNPPPEQTLALPVGHHLGHLPGAQLHQRHHPLPLTRPSHTEFRTF